MKTDLKADCSRCAALCCLMLAFDKGPKFGIDKPAGTACPHLARHSCSIHDRLEEKGFSGCIQYDCLGAGQIVVQEIYGGRSWQDEPRLTAPMADAFRLLREVQEMRQSLVAARNLRPSDTVIAACDALEARLTPEWSVETLGSFDLAAAKAEQQRLIALLRSELVPASVAGQIIHPVSTRRQ